VGAGCSGLIPDRRQVAEQLHGLGRIERFGRSPTPRRLLGFVEPRHVGVEPR
jgi:hypothetical protein